MNESVAKSAIHSSKKQQSQLQQNLISAVDDPMAPRNVVRVLPDNPDPMAPKNVGRVLPDGDKTEFVRDNRNPSQMQVSQISSACYYSGSLIRQIIMVTHIL